MREEERRSSWSTSRLRKAARKMILAAANVCGSFSSNKSSLVDPIASISGSCAVSPKKLNNAYYEEEEDLDEDSVNAEEFESSRNDSSMHSDKQKLCAICLEALKYSKKQQAIFTAQCSHAFHFGCISSNVRHGSVTCPICRAHWTHLPRNLTATSSSSSSSTSSSDPVLRILDDSIATFRVHRRSHLLRPSEHSHCRLRFSLSPSGECLSVGLSSVRRPIDVVLVATPNGPHLRLLKQCMALVVFSLRPSDRLALVTHSARVFPLRRMTPCGRRAALQVVDRLFYAGHPDDPINGLTKATTILCDRAGPQSPESAVLHLSDAPTDHPRSTVVPVHRFQVGTAASDGFVMRDFGEFLAGLLTSASGGASVTDVQLRVRTGDATRVVRIGELCSGEERRVLLDGSAGEITHAFVEYSYREEQEEDDEDEDEDEDEDDRSFVRGESLVSVGDDKSRSDAAAVVAARLSSSVESSWDYHDPYMARRWAKHLHGYRL